MNRRLSLLLAGVLLFPAAGRAWVQPVQYDNVGCCQFMQGCSSACDDHVGIDWMVNSAGRPVYAIGVGYDVDYFPSAGSFGGCGVAGGALWIKHRKVNGDYFWALYGHIRDPLYTSLGAGETIPAGAQVCEVANYDPCCPSGPNCPHLHFGIWDGPTRPSNEWGYGTQRSFVDPVAFLGNTDPPDPPYSCAWHSQNPSDVTVAPGQTISIWVKYRNTGTQPWTNTGNITTVGHAELWSCDAQGNIVNSWFNPVGWIGGSDQRVTVCDETTVAPDGLATFTFQAQVPTGIPDQDVRVWFRPTIRGDEIENWGGMNVYVHVRNPITDPCAGGPCPGRYIPNACLPSPGMCCPNSTVQSFPDLKTGQWQRVGQPVREVLRPHVQYSIGFEYEAASATDLTLGLGSFNPLAKQLGSELGSTTLPSTREWKTFWSAPFSLSEEQLRDHPNLRLLATNPSGIEYRNVRILAVRE